MQWLALAVTALIFAWFTKLTLKFISSRFRRLTVRSASIWDDFGVDVLEKLKSTILFVCFFYFLSHYQSQGTRTKKVLLVMVVTAIIWQCIIWGLHLIRTWRKSFIAPRIQENPSSAAALGLLYTATQAAFIATAVLIGLSNLGVDISALVAGLGVGGIAVALAAQNVLGDLLASLSIVLDKPFVVGDFIVAGEEKGTVEHIGVKTTRLRSLSGEQIVLSNKDLLESRIQNFKRMWARRVVLKFGVLYSTPLEQLEKIPNWVKDIVTPNEKLKFDRCHFAAYGASSLDYELVFFVQDQDYNIFMDLQQKVLLEIFRRFQQEKIDFAFPTQTIHIGSIPGNGASRQPSFGQQ